MNVMNAMNGKTGRLMFRVYEGSVGASGLVVENSTHHPKVDGLSPAITVGTGRKKMALDEWQRKGLGMDEF
jgi:hypothetical protein